jgi:hypothetical protein
MGEHMGQFYAQADNEDHCRRSVVRRRPITIIGLTADGKTREFTGMVHSVESGHTLHPGYPLRVTMLDSN